MQTLSTPIRNKDQTKRKLIEAVGEIIKTNGYIGLGVNKIAKTAGVDKKLIYRYFGNINYLIECYLNENDYWIVLSNKFNEDIDQNSDPNIEALVTGYLQNNFKFFYVRAAGFLPACSRMTLRTLAGTCSNVKGSIEYEARPLESDRIAVA